MKQPAFQFYPGDWSKDPALKACSHNAKGIWIDTLCLMFECSPRGVLITGAIPWSLSEWIVAVGGNQDTARRGVTELVCNGVVRIRGGEPSGLIDKYASILEGIPVGAYYSLRLVRDERCRVLTRNRVQRHRVTACNAVCNAPVTRMKQRSSSSSSSSDEEINKEPPLPGLQEPDPKAEFRSWVNKLFGRKAEQPWDEKEELEFSKVWKRKPSAEDIAVMEAYYTPRRQPYRRTNIERFLRHWNGELDQTRAEKEGGRKTSKPPQGNGIPAWQLKKTLDEEIATLANLTESDRTMETVALLKTKRAQRAAIKDGP